ncbi:tetratricopeptide repeat protein [Micromonospora sp. NBC_01813]|uniref:tetratricopeptide repeat protein n=1 Tax=Micromonospora sp. NBC_01813 TaxID=2975988 RepID=UPI002DD9E6B7|nr:hypothetical protein [Micromonospora sp. NBC_01813]WSA08503.1 hypothetical protein OG958_30705 [Micromonospora sp. NBC_01813]
MRRRRYLTLLGSALTSPAHEWIIAQQPSDVASATGRPLSGEVVDHLDTVTASLRRMDDHLGSGQTLGLVRRHLATVVEVLRERRYTDSVGRRLRGTAGELMRLAGWLSFDDGNHSQAQRFWIAGLYQAHATGDRGLGANILGFMSCQAKDLGQLRQSITLAETARASYPATSPKVGTILDLRAAEVYANNHAVADTRRALDSAFDRLTDERPEHGDPDWAYWINEAQAHAQAGYCYVKLEDWTRAREHLRAALRLQDNEYSREGALRHALLATTYVRQDQPELNKALALGDHAVQTVPAHPRRPPLLQRRQGPHRHLRMPHLFDDEPTRCQEKQVTCSLRLPPRRDRWTAQAHPPGRSFHPGLIYVMRIEECRERWPDAQWRWVGFCTEYNFRIG